jgi:hypothetical protein
MRDPGTIDLHGVIVHMLDPQGLGLTTSQRSLPLTDDLAAYFAAHVRNSLEDPSAKAATFMEIDDQAVSGVCAALLEGEPLCAAMGNDQRLAFCRDVREALKGEG